MKHLDKCKMIRNKDFRVVQPYMMKKSLQQSRVEFLWRTMMIDTRTTMKSKYEKDKYSCPTVTRAGRRSSWRLPIICLIPALHTRI